MKAELKNYQQSPRKVRLLADLVRGMDANRALAELSFMPQRAAIAVSKLVSSALANAQNNFKVDTDGLVIKTITVDEGKTLKRYRPRSRGMANPIRRRSSIIKIMLGQK